MLCIPVREDGALATSRHVAFWFRSLSFQTAVAGQSVLSFVLRSVAILLRVVGFCVDR